jgi:hypothetical protein
VLPASFASVSLSAAALLAIALDEGAPEGAPGRLVVGQLEVVEGVGGLLRSSGGEGILPCEAGRRFTHNRMFGVDMGYILDSLLISLFILLIQPFNIQL